MELENNLINIAIKYYDSILDKNFTFVEKVLHSDAQLISPLGNYSDKQSIITAAKKLSESLDTILIESKLSNENQVMLAYNFLFSKPELNLRAAVLMDFQNNKIKRIELFYDSKPFSEK